MDSASLTMLKKAGAQAAAVAEELAKPEPEATASEQSKAETHAFNETTVAEAQAVTAEVGPASADISEAAVKEADAKVKKAKAKKGQAVAVASKEGEVMPPDVIADIVHEIENLKEPQAHLALAEQLEIGPMSDFKIGGLLSLIKSNAWFSGYPKFEDYVANKVEPTTGIGYRKALYLVEIYNAIVESGLAWDKVKGIGWTKLQIIARVLKGGKAEQWLQIAKDQNAITLIGTVKEAVKGGNTAQLEDQSTKVKTTMTFQVHTDQKATIEAAIDKAKGIAQTDVSTVALEYICLDYMGGQTLSQRLEAVGPAQAGKAAKKAFADESALAVLMKELGLEEGLNAIAAAFPGINIDVSIPDGAKAQENETDEGGAEAA
jgi:hypothetical protein